MWLAKRFIRRVTSEDLPRVLDIWRGAVDATHHFLTAADRRDIETEVVVILPQLPLWLAVDSCDCPLGFMLLEGSHMEAPYIDSQQRGIGNRRALIEHALTIHSTITTDVNEQNTQALGFYLHIGFNRLGRSEKDNQGHAYPLLHMQLSSPVNTRR